MATIVFHGPNDSNECRRYVRKLAKELGGKFSYNSFFNARRPELHDGWFSEDTRGKAAYCVRIPELRYYSLHKHTPSRKAIAAIIRKYRKMDLPHGLKYRTAY